MGHRHILSMPTPTSAHTSPLSTTTFVNQIALAQGRHGGSNIAPRRCVSRRASRATVRDGQPCPTDLTKDEDIERLTDLVANAFGRLDILVHSPVTIAHGKLEEAILVVVKVLLLTQFLRIRPTVGRR